ncbi:hypothetical protein Fmac_023113 [Flemingia macrophylla]|uniref:Uncharacterized protein n=1 Tax=Flemingia macrophylla TaxID=520843 RepID=A0ABD1LKM8_9FABA
MKTKYGSRGSKTGSASQHGRIREFFLFSTQTPAISHGRIGGALAEPHPREQPAGSHGGKVGRGCSRMIPPKSLAGHVKM